FFLILQTSTVLLPNSFLILINQKNTIGEPSIHFFLFVTYSGIPCFLECFYSFSMLIMPALIRMDGSSAFESSTINKASSRGLNPGSKGGHLLVRKYFTIKHIHDRIQIQLHH